MSSPPPKLHGRRKGRPLRPGLQRLMDELLPRLAVTLPGDSERLDPAALFAPPRPRVWLEIGFGGGEHLAWQAARQPEVGLLGCEVFANGIATLLRALEAERLDNVRLHTEDARLLLRSLPDASLERAFLLFPDPWPKRRHAPRRFVQPETLAELARVLRDGAELRLASDDPKMQAWMLGHLADHPAFAWTARRPADALARPDDWPQTRYEAKALAEGRTPLYLRFVRRPRAGAARTPDAPAA
jgi:tRNA (guanine-N7-)-methyltransferase